ncbi:MAG: hypothetical protein HYY18_15005 [Planctomycetes bacterium]|nr:hypothetical protein [Planctomycetota bacterium]
MNPSCANRDEWLGPWAYDDLPFDQDMAAAEHVESCAACREEAAGLRAFVKRLPAPATAPTARRRRRLPFAIAAAALLAAALGFAAGHGTSAATVVVTVTPPPAPAPVARTVVTPAPASLFSPAMMAFLSGGSEALSDEAREKIRERAEEKR